MNQYEKIKTELSRHQYTWLITGVAGFIGSNLLETLLKLNQKVIGLDNFSTGFQQNIDDALNQVDPIYHANFYFQEGDICKLNDCQMAVKNVDFVLHHAALGSVPRSIATPELTNETNVTGFLNILMAAKDAKVKRFIYASSSAVYGDSPILPKTESHVGNPLSPYAVSKYSNELYASAFANCYHMETVGLRYFNIFGPRQSPLGPYAAVIPLWITALLKNEPIYINGDGETSRDFCYVDNAIQANLLAAMANRDAINKVYNITVGEQTTLNQLFTMLVTFLDLSQQPIYREFRNGDIRHSLADINQANKLLNYVPKHNVQKGLEQTLAWFDSKNVKNGDKVTCAATKN